MSGNAADTRSDEYWLEAATAATTIGELEAVVAAAKAAGAFSDRDLAWCRALWAAMGSGGHWAAIALVRRELGGELVAS